MDVEPDPDLAARTERWWTDRFADLYPQSEAAEIGIGDDAAVLRSDPRPQVVCVDPVVEGVHFESGTPLDAVGRKAVARNLSDLAAMGATPTALLVSILRPKEMPETDQEMLHTGIRDEALRFGASVVGGDLSTSPAGLIVTVTAIGRLEGRALTRSHAEVGDQLHLTGPLGGSFPDRHLRIEPRIDEGRWLATRSEIGGVMDVSDGLLLDLWTMLRASGVPGAEILLDEVPIHDDARHAGQRDSRPALEHALGDGEDHELLFTVRADQTLGAEGPLTSQARRPFGRLTDTPGLFGIDADGTRRELSPSGYQHGGERG